jgi:hypothetical protein
LGGPRAPSEESHFVDRFTSGGQIVGGEVEGSKRAIAARSVSYLVLCITQFALAFGALAGAQERTIRFAGRDWTVKDGDRMGPGPNDWSRDCVFVDARGRLHLRILHRDGRWFSAEVTTTERLGFGRYQFQVDGPIDKLDKSIVLGLFNYPTRDVGGDGTNEIDIEFARWAIATAPNGNFTVWPAKRERKQTSHTYEFALKGTATTQRFTWSPRSILFQSLSGYRDDDRAEIARCAFAPADYEDAIPQSPLPLHINLWLFRGTPPEDGKEVEIVIRSVTFTPEKPPSP